MVLVLNIGRAKQGVQASVGFIDLLQKYIRAEIENSLSENQ